MAVARPGDWQCPNPACTNHTQFPNAFVYGSNVNCPKCGTGKSATRAGDWCCPNTACVNHHNTVYGSKPTCSKCGAAKPQSLGKVCTVANGSGLGGMPARASVPTPRTGDWHCSNPSCKNHSHNLVFASKDTCPLCGSEKPDGTPAEVPPMWMKPGPAGIYVQQTLAERPGDWNCSNPTCKNHEDNFVYGSKKSCPLCGTPKDGEIDRLAAGGSMQPSGPSARRPGDWHCSNPVCKNHTENVVYSSKMSCPICGTPKGLDSGGSPMMPTFHPGNAATQSGPRPGDWQCPNQNCKNHLNCVYGSKATCSLCGADRPMDTMDGRQRSRSPRHA